MSSRACSSNSDLTFKSWYCDIQYMAPSLAHVQSVESFKSIHCIDKDGLTVRISKIKASVDFAKHIALYLIQCIQVFTLIDADTYGYHLHRCVGYYFPSILPRSVMKTLDF